MHRRALVLAIAAAWLLVCSVALVFVMRPDTPRFVKFLLLGLFN